MHFWRIVPPPPRPWAQSVAPAGWQGRVPRQSRPPCHSAGAAARTHTRAPSPQGAGSRLTPFAPVIRGHKCLFGALPPAAPPLGAVGSPCSPGRAANRRLSAQTYRGCRPHPYPCALPQRGRAPNKLEHSKLKEDI